VPRSKRTTKRLAQRIDLNYFKHPHRFRESRFLLSALLPVAALLWLVGYGLAHNNKLYSAGPMSPAHATLTKSCESCHVASADFFGAKANDRACLACHDGPIHHENQVFTPSCSSCHVEHRGRIQLAATPDTSCTQCHAHLQTRLATPNFTTSITSFETGHPEFAALRPGFTDPGTIKVNHAVHMKANLAGPHGPVQLACGDCHRPGASTQPPRFGSAAAEANVAQAALASPVAALAVVRSFGPPSHSNTRAYMAPTSYSKHCAGCHTLLFDKRFAEGVPHDTPDIIHAFLIKKFQEYIAAHPAELRESVSTVALPAKPLPVSPRVYTPQQWVNARVTEAEQLLWGKTCKQCHSLTTSSATQLPAVVKSDIAVRWFQDAVFDHDQHRFVTCESCHAKARTSQERADILLPGILVCQQCHHSGSEGVESRCFECHEYHDWSNEKELNGKLTTF
jgi:hypothetical protein